MLIRLSSLSDMVTSILMYPWPEDWIFYARKSDITKWLKVTSEYLSYMNGTHNKDYVKYVINNNKINRLN